jgi:acyl carrier protein
MTMSPLRQAIFDALKTAAPDTFDHELRRAFRDDGVNLVLADLHLDSLTIMEFCIAIEVATGAALVPADLGQLPTTDAIEDWLRQALR